MKKIGKKLSFLTKILLVIGLLISNLSSLTVVFANETTDDILISLDGETLKINYNGELTVEEVNVDVYENYTYLDNNLAFNEDVKNSYNFKTEEIITAEEVVNEELNEVSEEMVEESVALEETQTYEALNSQEEQLMTSSIEEPTLEDFLANGLEMTSVVATQVFDGLYEVKVVITDALGGEIASAVSSQNITHKSGLELKLYDENENEITLIDGKYPVTQDNSKVKVVAKVLLGGLSPLDKFTCSAAACEDEEYLANAFINEEFHFEMVDFAGHLFGEYTLPVEIKFLNANQEEVVFSENMNVLYESYAKNAYILNSAVETLELEKSYIFDSTSKDGNLFVLLNADRVNTMLDLYKMLEMVTGDVAPVTDIESNTEPTISYVLSNSEYADIVLAYNNLNSELTIEEFMDTILLDDTTSIELINEGLTINYNVVIVGDLNSDYVIDELDLSELIEQVLGNKEVVTEKSDLYGNDEKVDLLDVMYLDQVIKNNDWNVSLSEDIQATLNAILNLNGENLVSGDEFTIDYVLSLSEYTVNGVAGLFKYDETMFELISIDAMEDWTGSNNAGKFIFLGKENLKLPEIESTVALSEGETEEVITEDYVVVTATFRALKAGVSTISIEEYEFFEQENHLLVDEMILSVDVEVTASDNNNLSSLTVAGQTITLVDDVYEYEITVDNEITSSEVEAIIENIAAQIINLSAPVELAEGENEIVFTVVSESGLENTYVIKVIREKAPKKETTTYVNYDYGYDDSDDDNETVAIPSEDDEVITDEKEDDSTLSRVIIIILILLVIAGLIYLIFKDEDDEETKKANKDISRLKKEDIVPKKTSNKTVGNNKNSKTSTKNKGTQNKKKER